MTDTYKEIPMSQIFVDDELNSRGKVSNLDVTDLIQSIREYGLKQPIVVRKLDSSINGFDYGLVAGFRRYTAHVCMGREMIMAKVEYNLSDTDARIINLQENIIRKDLNLLQEAKSIQKLKWAGVTMESVARRLNVSIGWVQIRYMVLNFSEAIQKEIAEGNINQQQIKALSTLPRDVQAEEVKRIKDKRARGEKGMEIKRPISSNSKRARTRAEMTRMLDHIYQEVEPNFATRALAWCIGNISSAELYQDIKEQCELLGKYGYIIPDEEL